MNYDNVDKDARPNTELNPAPLSLKVSVITTILIGWPFNFLCLILCSI